MLRPYRNGSPSIGAGRRASEQASAGSGRQHRGRTPTKTPNKEMEPSPLRVAAHLWRYAYQ